MPFTFKLSQRLARMRHQGHVAPVVAPAIAAVFSCDLPTTAAPDSDTSPRPRLTVSPNLPTLQQNQTADQSFVGIVELLYERSPKAEREDLIEVGKFEGTRMSPYLTMIAVERCGRRSSNTFIDNVLRDYGKPAWRVPSGEAASTT